MNNEDFYNIDFLPLLRLRSTFGYNGNVYNASAFLTATYRNSFFTGERMATITSPPNPDLRWEQVQNTNIAVDFAFRNNRLSGSIDWYQKKGLDLIANTILAPSSSFYSYKGNSASTQTRGIDVELNSKNLTGSFKWNTTILFNYLSDKVLKYDDIYIQYSNWLEL